MSTRVSTQPIAEASPRFKGKFAGVVYLLSALAAVSGEFFVHGGLSVAMGLIAAACYIVVTLLLYDIFKVVNRRLSLLAGSFNLVALNLEALRWNPRGVDIAMVFHGCYCLLIAYLILTSTFLPRILGALMMFAGLDWLTYLSPMLADSVSPYNLVGLIGEGALCVWLLVVGLHLRRWEEQAGPQGS